MPGDLLAPEVRSNPKIKYFQKLTTGYCYGKNSPPARRRPIPMAGGG
jgi:hypothetical protein